MTTSTPATSDLISLSASEMARQVAHRHVTSRELVEAHIRRIEAVNPRLNAVVIPRFAAARAEAEQADAALARGEAVGPLHGVPITIKECFHLAGTDATQGVGGFVGQPMTADGPLVRRLRAAGAIVLGKTNLPQLMLLHESDNPVYGRPTTPGMPSAVPAAAAAAKRPSSRPAARRSVWPTTLAAVFATRRIPAASAASSPPRCG